VRQLPAGKNMCTETEDNVESCYQAMPGEDIEDFTYAAVQ
jgi:hypothetical protein